MKPYNLDHARKLLTDVADAIQLEPWFSDEWKVSVHNYPPEPATAESVSMHLFKVNWFNADRQGIHFETHLSAKEWSRQSVPLMLHMFHTPTIPGTTIKRIQLSKPVVDATFDTISDWNGYKFRVGKYGTQPFSCEIKFDADDLTRTMLPEIRRLVQTLTPEIDKTLNALLNRAQPAQCR